MSEAYYNEFDSTTAAWLEELIRKGHIAPGQVDTRSIEDVRPDDLRGFTQCHFFAGIGVWSYALRRAGWPDDRPVWTGSCPCQPFSSAGKGAAFDDERHLWPAFHHLIKVCRPASILGEQVASASVDDWIDLVQADLEAMGYSFGSVPFPSAGVGAPHIRDRLYWVANANDGGRQRRWSSQASNGRDAPWIEPERLRHANGLGHASGSGLGERERGILGGTPGAVKGQTAVGTGIHTGGMADAELQQRQDGQPGIRDVNAAPGREQSSAAAAGFSGDLRPGPINGYWRTADWLGCTDGKCRPVEPGTFPLAHGSSARVVRLRGYGNAINAEAAKVWIETVMECIA